MEIKHVFFDLDHTLWDFERNSKSAFGHIFEKHQLSIDIVEFSSIYSPINEKYWKLYRDESVTKEVLRYNRLRETFDLMKIEVVDRLIDLLAHDYIEHLADYNEVFEHTFEVLDYLKAKYTLHIITNGFEEVQHRKLSNSNLLPYFRNIITSERVGVKKPNPKIFVYAMEWSKATAKESIMIGDNLEADVEGALAVGMQAIHFNIGIKTSQNGHLTVDSLLKIKDFL